MVSPILHYLCSYHHDLSASRSGRRSSLPGEAEAHVAHPRPFIAVTLSGLPDPSLNTTHHTHTINNTKPSHHDSHARPQRPIRYLCNPWPLVSTRRRQAASIGRHAPISRTLRLAGTALDGPRRSTTCHTPARSPTITSLVPSARPVPRPARPVIYPLCPFCRVPKPVYDIHVARARWPRFRSQ